MSPYGWKVGTVATTTVSPVAACSARIRRSSSAALAGVDDVGEVVDRRGQRRRRRLRRAPAECERERRAAAARAHRRRCVMRAPASCRRTPRRARRRRCSASRSAVGSAIVLLCPAPPRTLRARRLRGMPICAFGRRRDVGVVDRRSSRAMLREQRAERRLTRLRSGARSPRVAASFEKAFAQVDQMALGLRARTRAARRSGMRHAGERIGAGNEHVVRDDVAVLEREDVERARSNSVAFEEQRHRRARRGASRSRPRARTRRGRRRRAVDEGERVEQLSRAARSP